MGPDDRRLRRQRRLDVEEHVGLGDLESTHSGLGLPEGLEIQGKGVDGTKMLHRLLARLEPKGVRLETEGNNRGGREQGEAIPTRLVGSGPLEQAMDQNDVAPSQLVATGDATVDEGPVVDEHLEVEARCQPA